MYKVLPIVVLIVAVAAAATLIPSTSQAFLGPVWVPFSGGCHSGCGIGSGFGGFGGLGGFGFRKGHRHAGYGGYGYAWPYSYGYGPYYTTWYGY